MKKIYFLAILILGLVANAFALTLSEFEKISEADVKAKATEQLSKDYPDNPAEIQLLLDRGMADFNKLKGMYPAMGDEEKKLFERLLKDYDCAFSTILMLYEDKTQETKQQEVISPTNPNIFRSKQESNKNSQK